MQFFDRFINLQYDLFKHQKGMSWIELRYSWFYCSGKLGRSRQWVVFKMSVAFNERTKFHFISRQCFLRLSIEVWFAFFCSVIMTNKQYCQSFLLLMVMRHHVEPPSTNGSRKKKPWWNFSIPEVATSFSRLFKSFPQWSKCVEDEGGYIEKKWLILLYF